MEHLKSKIIPDVLCPWGCSEFAFRCADFDPSLMIQYHLRSVQLNLPNGNYEKMHFVDSTRQDYLRDGEHDSPDHVLMNPDWPILPTMSLHSGKGPMVCTCRHHSTASKWKRLCPHPLRKPKGMILSSVRPDQLCQARLQPRIVKPVVKRGLNTVPSLNLFTCGYTGSDCASVSIDARFENTGPKPMNFEHEVTSLHRLDLVQHARLLIEDRQLSNGMLSDWMSELQRRTEANHYRNLTLGATWTPTVNAVRLQSASSEEHRVLVTVKQKTRAREPEVDVTIPLARSWCPAIYNLQHVDHGDYGWPMKAISPMRPNVWKQSTMLTWALVGLISSSEDLYHIVDQAVGGHSYKTPSGHLLTFVHHKYMKHCDPITVKGSPVKPNMSQTQLCNVIEGSMAANLLAPNGHEENYFMFGRKYFRSVFHRSKFPKLSITGAVANLTSRQVEGKDVFIQINKAQPTGNAFVKVGSKPDDRFEARVVVAVTIKTDDFHENEAKWKFTGMRLSRHGGGLKGWWKQERSPQSKCIMTRVACIDEEGADTFPALPGDCSFYVVLYARVKQFEVEEYKLDMHRSLGGQCSVFCDCNEAESPLIVAGTMEQEKRNCTTRGCKRREGYMCPVDGCSTRICGRCFQDLSSPSNSKRVVLSREPEDISSSANGIDLGRCNDHHRGEDSDSVDEPIEMGGDVCLQEDDESYVPDGDEEEDEDDLIATDDYNYGEEGEDEGEVSYEDQEAEDDDGNDAYEYNEEGNGEDDWGDFFPDVDRRTLGVDNVDPTSPLNLADEQGHCVRETELEFIDVPQGFYDEDRQCVWDSELSRANDHGGHDEGDLLRRDGTANNQPSVAEAHRRTDTLTNDNSATVDMGNDRATTKKEVAQKNARLSAAGRQDGKHYGPLDRNVSCCRGQVTY